MAELPSGLLEACVVLGASADKLRDIHQVDKRANNRFTTFHQCRQTGNSDDFIDPPKPLQLQQQGKLSEPPHLEAEVLQVHAPPFVSKETNSNQAIGPAFSRVQRRRSFIKKVIPRGRLDKCEILSETAQYFWG